MNRYKKIFSKLNKESRIAFIPFWMVGDPTLEKSVEIIEEIAKNADILELGIPFSDPLADGPVIQDAVNRALEFDVNTRQCLKVIQEIRTKFPEKPIGLLVYFNLIISFGVENFLQACQKSGVDSILIPELPIEEVNFKIDFEDSAQSLAKKYKIDLIFLVSTNTPKNRRKKIFKIASGFIYAVSAPTLTGSQINLEKGTTKMVNLIKNETKIPVCVGFGIATTKDIQILHKAGANGAIIGSAIIKFYQKESKKTNHKTALKKISSFCQKCKIATKD